MVLTNTSTRYGLVPQLLHWLVLILLIVQFLLAEAAEDAPEGAAQLATLAWHKSVGITLLLLAFTRVAWRLFDRPPPLPPQPRWQAAAATSVHWALYALLFALPLTGWMMSSADGHSVSWFGVIHLPDLVMPSESLEEILHEVHEALATGLLVLAGIHVLAALKHQFVDRDGLMSRMLPWGGRG